MAFQVTTKRWNENLINGVVTVADHALVCSKFYELTENPAMLFRGADYLLKKVTYRNGVARWKFSDTVEDIPADLDTTSFAFIHLLEAERNGLRVPKKVSAAQNPRNVEQLYKYVTPNGGVYTFFAKTSEGRYRYHGLTKANDVDPMPNSSLVFLLLRLKESGIFHDNLYGRIRQYWNWYLLNGFNGERPSEYFQKPYVAQRAAKIQSFDREFLEPASEQKLVEYLLVAKPINPLQAAWLSTACSLTGLQERARKLNQMIDERRIELFLDIYPTHNQRTPPVNYGSEAETSLFALEALQKDDRPHQALKTLEKMLVQQADMNS